MICLFESGYEYTGKNPEKTTNKRTSVKYWLRFYFVEVIRGRQCECAFPREESDGGGRHRIIDGEATLFRCCFLLVFVSFRRDRTRQFLLVASTKKAVPAQSTHYTCTHDTTHWSCVIACDVDCARTSLRQQGARNHLPVAPEMRCFPSSRLLWLKASRKRSFLDKWRLFVCCDRSPLMLCSTLFFFRF